VNESHYTSKLMKALKEYLPDALIWKVSDRFNAGRPDFQVIVGGRTTYVECKMHPHRPTKLQQHYLDEIGEAACWVQFGKEHTIYWRSKRGDWVGVPCSYVKQVAGYLYGWCSEA
jgi:hypothetical protein